MIAPPDGESRGARAVGWLWVALAGALPLLPGLATGLGLLLILVWLGLGLRGRAPSGPLARPALGLFCALWWATVWSPEFHFYLGGLISGGSGLHADPRWTAGRQARIAWLDYWHYLLLPAGALWAGLGARWMRRALAAFLGASALAVLAGLIEFASGWNLRWNGIGPAFYSLAGNPALAKLLIGRETLARTPGRVYGFFDHPLTYGGYLAVALLLCVALWRAGPLKRAARAIAIPATALALLAANRAYWFGLAAGAFTFGRRRPLRAGLLALAAIALATGTAWLLPATRERAAEMAGAAALGDRACFWRAGGELAARRPLTGWGIRGYRLHAQPALSAHCPGVRNLTHAHSAPLQLLAEGGLPLLAAWLWLVWRCASALRERADSPLARGALAALAAFLAAGLLEWNFGDKEAALPLMFWIAVAIHAPADPEAAPPGK